jgi:hypothetical protein
MEISKIEFGYSPEKEEVILRTIIARHGPKLTAEGEKNDLADYFDDHVIAGFENMDINKAKDGLIRVNTSDVKRAVDTANIHNEQLKKTGHRRKEYIKTNENLAVPLQPIEDAKEERFAQDLDTIMKMQSEIKPTIKDQVEKELSSLDEKEREAELRNRIDMQVLSEMFEDENREDKNKKFKTSYKELADIFAKRYARLARHKNLIKKMKNDGGKQPEDEPYMQIDVTHSFPVSAFLKKYLVFDDGGKSINMESGEFFEKTGGIIRESGSFNMDYIVDDSDELKIAVKGDFSGSQPFSGEVDMRALAELNK